LEGKSKSVTAKFAKKFSEGRKGKQKQRQNQSAIPGVGRKLMAESTISHPDWIIEFVYSAKTASL
jgi:hypothetical protein